MKLKLIFLIFIAEINQCFTIISILPQRSANGIIHFLAHDKPEFFFNTEELSKYQGYTIEKYVITTDDGYILQIFRVPYGIDNKNGIVKRPVVLLQHGHAGSSDDFVVNLKQSLAFVLADEGFDVWISNSRGNIYCKNHTDPQISKKDFFQFSFDEMGEFDLPATINYILKKTDHENLQLVGHSMGTSMSFAMLLTKLEFNQKVKSFHALAPVVKLDHFRSLLGLLAPINGIVQALAKLLDIVEIFRRTQVVLAIASQCDSVTRPICELMYYIYPGFGPQQMNFTRLPIFQSHQLNAGASLNSLAHYSQIINSHKFQHYDHGRSENLQKYGQDSPPTYYLGKVTTPVHLYYGASDLLVAPVDVEGVQKELPNCVESYRVPLDAYTHMDFIWAKDNKILLNDHLISQLKKYI